MNLTDILYCSPKMITDTRRRPPIAIVAVAALFTLNRRNTATARPPARLAPVMPKAAAGERAARRRSGNQLANIRGG
jgi:hypothetical protein